MNQAFKPPPSTVRCLCQQPGPQSWRPRSGRLLSTSPACHSNISREQRRAEDRLLGSSEDDKENASATGLSALSTLAQKTRGSEHQNNERFMERVQKNVFEQPYETASPAHNLHVFAHRRSTIITLTRPNHEVMLTQACGNIGFRHAKRKGYDPAHQLTSHTLARIQEQGWLQEIKRLELIFRDFGPGREAFTKILLGNEGKNFHPLISRVTDATRLKFGGTRSPQVRRLG